MEALETYGEELQETDKFIQSSKKDSQRNL
jgi:hypothetical protein